MVLFNYKAIDNTGNEIAGSIDAINQEVAISALQRRGLIISAIDEDTGKVPFLDRNIGENVFSRVSNREIVILSRQVATLFEAQVSALKVFSLLGAEVENPLLKKILIEVSNDLQGGSSISTALAKHPKAFTEFYVSMVKVGEESGKLEQIFNDLADYLDRTYEVANKARNALIYPAFVIVTFIAVMILMMTMVIPRISTILVESGQEVPFYTTIVLGVSNFLVDYGIFLLILVVIGIAAFFRYGRTGKGKTEVDKFKLLVPYLGTLYRKLYLSRLADNMHTMLLAGIPMVKAIQTTANVVDNDVYKALLEDSAEAIRGGATVSSALSGNEEIPGIMVQMMKIGEETGELGNILKTLGDFYRREVNNAVDTLIDLIEPAMIVALGAGVGILLASVLIPIYNISTAI